MATVVILLSDKRSGSTILQEEICRHGDIRHVDTSPHTYFETHHWLKAAVILARPPALFSGGGIYSGYGSAANARAYMRTTLETNIPGYVCPDNDEAMVFEGWERLCRHFATPVFFEKSPQILAHWAALDLLHEWMARTELSVKIIGLVRNPLAVQYSAQELFMTEPEARQFGWLEIQKNLLSFSSMLPRSQFHMLRYEDMIHDPEASLSRLCEFIGVNDDSAIGSGIHANSVEKWRKDSNYTLQLDPAVTRLAMAFGYTKEDLHNPNTSVAHGVASPPRRVLRRWMNRSRDRFFKPLLLRVNDVLGNWR